MNIFSVKSLGLYSLAIGGSIAFFQLVTSYGEANVKAPIAITGKYLITSTNLPDCLARQQLALDLQQSGIYLNASLASDLQLSQTTTISRPTLSGKLAAGQDRIDLIGALSIASCPQPLKVQISGSIHDRRLQGQMLFDDAAKPIEFTGILQPISKSASAH
jgi:hypothetical protein